MVEELFKMYTNAKGEAVWRMIEGDLRGYSDAMDFAFRCKQLAADIMKRPVVGFEF